MVSVMQPFMVSLTSDRNTPVAITAAFDIPTDIAREIYPPVRSTKPSYLMICSRSLQDIESSRSYIDELYSPDQQKCLEAIM